ncbi:MAG: UDP-N-acetylmuramate dehydrogenase [Raoultibacter sp.]
MAIDRVSALQLLRFDDTFAGSVRVNESMARHTTYRIGGPARFFIEVESISALSQILGICHKSSLPWIVLGKGSNLLVSDEGFSGAVIVLAGDFKHYLYDEEKQSFTVGCAASLSHIVQEAFKRSLAGFEFAVGTPGTLGGALRMNAGSSTEYLGDHVVSVTTFSLAEGLKCTLGSNVVWEYRHSSIPADEVIVECELRALPGNADFIRGKMEGLLARRKKSQPLRYPSCGSVFKNPEGKSAGALIEAVGLKGQIHGGAQISEVHANFIVNIDNASAVDVRALIDLAARKVKEAYGIELTPEVRFLGFA